METKDDMMTRNRKYSIWPEGAALLACLLLGACSGEGRVGQAATTNDDPVPPGIAAKQAGPTEVAGDEPVGDRRSGARRPGSLDLARISREQRAKELFQAYACQTKRCKLEAFSARTPEEASWLAMRGYPTAARREELERLSLGELALAAERNDLAARAVLGRRLIEDGDKEAGYEQLLGAAYGGSVYADYELSRVNRSQGVVESAAYLRRAYLQGDAKAATELYARFPRRSLVEWDAIDKRAMRLYLLLLQERARRGRGRMPIGARPQ